MSKRQRRKSLRLLKDLLLLVKRKIKKYVKGMKKSAKEFKDRYGDEYKSVMYATATKMAKEEVVDEAAAWTQKGRKE